MTILSSRRANVNLNTGGGNKKQGLAPKATNFFIAPYTGYQYSVGSGDGRDRFRLVCMNQLGGIGRGRSQFGPSADGTICPIDDLTLQYIDDINAYVQDSISTLIASNPIYKVYNISTKFELCYVGNIESLLSDISINRSPLYNKLLTLNSEGNHISKEVFTHFDSQTLTDGSAPIYFSIDTSGTSLLSSETIPLNDAIRTKINYVNKKLPKQYPLLFTQDNIANFGLHTLGIINTNLYIDSSNVQDILLSGKYGKLIINNIRTYTYGCPGATFTQDYTGLCTENCNGYYTYGNTCPPNVNSYSDW